MNRWINFLSLIPGTTLTILIIGIAFLRFYDESDFTLLGQVTSPRLWSNRLTVAAILVALVNFGIEWDRRNRETDRLAQEAQRRAEEGQRRAEEEQRRAEEEQRRSEDRARAEEDRARAEEDRARAETERAEANEQTARRARIEIERDLALLGFLADPTEQNQQRLLQIKALLDQYRDTLA